MLDKTNYSSWASRMLLYIKGKEHGKLLVDSVLNGPFHYGTMVEPNETTPATVRARTYSDLTDEEKIRGSVDIKATNIVLQDLPQYIYSLVNHNEDAKQIWDRVKLLNQDLELSLQERESKLYDDFDIFTYMPGETNHSYYMRQHEAHANEVRLSRQRYPDQIALVANSPTCLNPIQYYLQLSSATQQYHSPPAPKCSYDAPMLRTSSNPINQATIQDGRVTVQTVQGRQTQGHTNTGARNNATNQGVNRNGGANTPGQERVVKCYNCQEEGDFARQCTKPKRPKNSAWFKKKMLPTEALESGAYLDPEQLAFLADNKDTIFPA
ncbi:reverse transcriptase domain-containing protein [Tanacetum coccineum]